MRSRFATNLMVAFSIAGSGALAAEAKESTMKIRLTLQGAVLTATLEDNAASRDFLAMLPLDLTLADYNATEKIADLPARLSTDGSPEGVDPSVGDITYFAPWGNLAIFYRDFRYSRGLIRLGAFDGNIDALRQPGPLNATIERIEP
ncbi:cyclophilin-like fold protein [Paenirhodobacter sp.]|uniref:cyclophilin-like fold protein n=1 Tax=Paenirhodobacter sp. TaxID=1965326 RepID=UPI003B3CB624